MVNSKDFSTNKFSLIDFFGILSPGILMLLAIILSIVGIAKFNNIILLEELKPFQNLLKDWIPLISVTFFFVSYFLGSVIRLFSVNFTDVLSVFFLRMIKDNPQPILEDSFPYCLCTKAVLDYGNNDYYEKEFEKIKEINELLTKQSFDLKNKNRKKMIFNKIKM